MGLRTAGSAACDDLVSVAAAVVLPASDARLGAVPVASAAVEVEVDGDAVRVDVDTLLNALRLRLGVEAKHGAVEVGAQPLPHRAA